MDLSIAIVSWNTKDLLDQCLRSVYDSAGEIELEVVVVDNASTDGSPEMVRSTYPQAALISNSGNVGFARANNQAYHASRGRHFMLLNPDTICLPGALRGLVEFLDHNTAVGAVGPLVLNDDSTLQYSWATFPTLISEIRGNLDRHIASLSTTPITADQVRALGPFATGWVGGCALMIRRDAVEQVGVMDESLFMYSEETDWCLRLSKAGWEVWVEPAAEIIHLGGRSSGQIAAKAASYLRRSKRQYFAKHHGPVAGLVIGGVLAAKYHFGRLVRR